MPIRFGYAGYGKKFCRPAPSLIWGFLYHVSVWRLHWWWLDASPLFYMWMRGHCNSTDIRLLTSLCVPAIVFPFQPNPVTGVLDGFLNLFHGRASLTIVESDFLKPTFQSFSNEASAANFDGKVNCTSTCLFTFLDQLFTFLDQLFIMGSIK